MSCSMGVMPEPPAIMPMYFFMFGVYVNFCSGPFSSMVSPNAISPKCLRRSAACHVHRRVAVSAGGHKRREAAGGMAAQRLHRGPHAHLLSLPSG